MQRSVLVAAVALQAMGHKANTRSFAGKPSAQESFKAWFRDARNDKVGVVRWYHRALRNIFAHTFGTAQETYLEQYPAELRIFSENGRLSQALMPL